MIYNYPLVTVGDWFQDLPPIPKFADAEVPQWGFCICGTQGYGGFIVYLLTTTNKKNPRTSLVVQWLRLCPPNAGGLGSFPGRETRSHMLQLRVCMPQLKIPDATVQIEDSRCCN